MIAGPVVVDASVVVEYLVDLGRTRATDRLFGALVDADRNLELWAPDLVYAECASALRKLVARKAVPATAGGRAIDQLRRLPLRVTGTRSLLREMWSLRGRLTSYDACYLALARRLDVPLVTADEKLARATRGVRVLLLEELDSSQR